MWEPEDNGSELNRCWLKFTMLKDKILNALGNYIMNMPMFHLWFLVVTVCVSLWVLFFKVLQSAIN